MSRKMKWITPLFAFALLGALSTTRARAADAPPAEGKGGVSGKVLDKDGNPAAGVNVRLFHPFARGERPGGAGKPDAKPEPKSQTPLAADDAAAPKPQQPAKGEKGPRGERPQPVASAVTNADGAFTLADVPAGKYVLLANIRGQGNARQPVEIKAGETATVELKLKPREAGARKEEKKAE